MSKDEGTFAEEMIFDANLKEFAARVSIVCGLESGGRISQEEAYRRIKDLWKQLKRSRKNLIISDEARGSGSSSR
jgi:hypothetical protein